VYFPFCILEKRVLKLDSATATINMEVDDNVGAGLRRSKRNRVPCLQYWKNDRIEYERRQSGKAKKKYVGFLFLLVKT
jgi:hypothetical protein